MNLSLVVMAAGLGSRYGGNKQTDNIGPSGEIMMEYGLYDGIKAGFNKVVFIISKPMETSFQEAVGDKIAQHVQVEYVIQDMDFLPEGYSKPEGRTKPLGTGHAIYCIKDVVNEPFVVMNADDFYGANAFNQLAKALGAEDAKENEFFMAGYYLKNTLSDNGHVSRGVCGCDENNNLIEINERKKIMPKDGVIQYEGKDGWVTVEPDTLVSMNMFGFTPKVFDVLHDGLVKFLEDTTKDDMKDEYFLPLTIDAFIKEGVGNVKVLEVDEKWFGVTYAEDKPLVQKSLDDMIAAGRYGKELWSGM